MQIVSLPECQPIVRDVSFAYSGGRILLCRYCGKELARWWSPNPNVTADWPPELQDSWTPIVVGVFDRFLLDSKSSFAGFPPEAWRAFFLHSLEELARFSYIRIPT